MPEERKRFKVGRGARVEIGIAGDPEETKRPELPRGETPRGLAAEAEEDEPLLRRLKKGALTFHDLGTRLRSVPPTTNFNDYTRTRPVEPPPEPAEGFFNEYLEIPVDAEAENLRRLIRPPYDAHTFDDYTLGTNHLQADIPTSVQTEYDAALLGSLREGSADEVSPLDKFKANGSGRELPACAPVAYVQTVFGREDYHESDDYPTEAFDFTLYNDDKELRFPNTTFRESVEDLRAWADDDPAAPSDDVDVQAVFNGMDFLKNERWKEREHREEDDEDSERWNPNNLFGGEAKRGAEHDQKGQGGGFNLKLESRLIYEPFDTGDAENFKVTKEPDFESDEVSLKLSGKPTRVFLRPQLLAFGRAEEYQSGYNVRMKSHTWRDNPSQTPWVHHKTQNFQTNYTGGAFIDIGFNNVYDPAATPQTFTVTVTKTASAGGNITATVSGTPNADGSYTWPVGLNQTIHPAPGIEMYIFMEASVPNGKWMSEDVVPNRQPFDITDTARATVVRGMHVGRWPFVPRSGVGGWDSMLTFCGQRGYEYDDAYNGVHYVYDPAVSVTLPGRAAFFSGVASVLAQVYDRHASADLNRFAYLTSVVSARQYAFDHFDQQPAFTEETCFAIQGAEFVGGVFDAAAALDALNAQVAAAAHTVGEQVFALESYFEDLEADVNLPGGYNQRMRVDIVPPYTVPAGILCAIIEHGSSVFYVWRRTPETRGGYDGERNQGAMPYPFLFPYS